MTHLSDMAAKKKLLSDVKKKYFAKDTVLADEAGVRPEWNCGDWYVETLQGYLDVRKKSGQADVSDQREKAVMRPENRCPSGDQGINPAQENSASEVFPRSVSEALPQIPEELQAQMLWALKNMFYINTASRNRGALKGAQLEQYLELCRDCLGLISNDLISAEESMPEQWRLRHLQWSALMGLKYGRTQELQIRDGRLYCADSEMSTGLESDAGSEMGVDSDLRTGLKMNQEPGLLPFVTLDLMEYVDSYLRLDFCIDTFLLEKGLQLEVRLNGKPVEYQLVPRYTGTSIFGEKLARRTAFVLKLADGKAERLIFSGNSECRNYKETVSEIHTGKAVRKRNIVVEFILMDKCGQELVLPVLSVDYQARVTGLLRNSWWSFQGKQRVAGQKSMVVGDEKTAAGKPIGRAVTYMVTLRWNQENRADGILICRAGRMKRMRREVDFLKEIVSAKYGSRQMFLMRCLYWLVYPVCSRRRIWVTFDKLYKGGDCGEYFYKYMTTRKDQKIHPVYVMRSDAADFKRLQQEGYAPAVYRSVKQRLAYLFAEMVFATHSGVHSFCGFSKWEIRFLQDRLKAVNSCIQHGLSVQDLTVDSNRILNNNKRYYCASHCEVENLSKPAYDYAPDVLKLTGIPRYDGLVNCDQKQILITPTWRSYIAMPSVMGASRPYNPEFKNTDYYKLFQALLQNKKLSDAAKRTGYKVIYLLHPVISAQKEDFCPGEGIELVSALDINYEKILTESSLMVTDYSGVQFDFAYMRKPVVYYHPPKLPPHYDDGGFFYDTQGFGEICTETDELVETLCEYMKNGCELKEFYRARQDEFFAFSDHENCKRIYEDALSLMRRG